MTYNLISRFIFILLMAYGCSDGVDSNDQLGNMDPIKVDGKLVSTVIINEGPYNMEIITNGILHAKENVSISTTSSGVISKVYFQNGEKITTTMEVYHLEPKKQLKNEK